MLEWKINLLKSVLISLLVLNSSLAMAHTVWLEPAEEENIYNILFGGHGGKLVFYDPQKIRKIAAFDTQGKHSQVKRLDNINTSQLHIQPNTALIAIYFDNGIWSKDKQGKSINKPMNQVPYATRATHAVKYHKTVLKWSSVVLKPLGQEFEVIPLDDHQPEAGKAMRVKVLLKGEPLAGVKLGHGEIGEKITTNAEGIAEFVPKPGFNKLWAGKRFQVQQENFTELSYEYLFGFYTGEKK
ncbi:DUF4198 domain-containing protein [Thalassotalea sp. 1_MG-2023]|uniref:DUF4198 domain-containing protein n=1 Tax=Thalassotalea sp. 1_MG-2023 TaxID=3062680 RepID=UPI0026E46C0F|nr:DUF4198 domain-containing protein [Thalassotalea sp. 1_MG-2023]MDO6426702.1 DUF4198 domain-containing protein [Thalassotalea sp. 1_MG-2023]